MAKAKPLTLFSLLWKPLVTWRKMYRVFESVEFEPVVRVRAMDSFKKPLTEGDFVVLGDVCMPALAWKAIQPALLKIHYRYVGTERVWDIPDNQNLDVRVVTGDELKALFVAKRFKDAGK